MAMATTASTTSSACFEYLRAPAGRNWVPRLEYNASNLHMYSIVKVWKLEFLEVLKK